ncbi:hypothetical protein B0I35DRAFT_405040 [Stachybotrys elegans]|uniref:Uncharacterized protein n=1 Tax=Stachybotrys elegans TaxID=80388 RepID=A0A8K0WUI1_9HYPO|nr:hypothetical protein B0I35DRAFT_405040 [Stachybotrys elegans]
MSNFTEKDIPDLTGYTAIVTGGNSGIGYETTKQLALHNARVYIASRNLDRVQKAIDELNQQAGRKLDLHSLQMDLVDLKSVKAAAADFSAREERLDILINNAGVMNVPFKLTKDGYETQWQANYVAPHVFTAALLPKLLATAAAYDDKTRVRVVNVSSDLAFNGPKTINMADPNMTKAKGMMELQQRYGHSKQAIIRDAVEINNRYASQGVTAFSVHPGIVKSGLQNSDPSLMGKIIRLAIRLSPTTHLQAAYNSLWCATTPAAAKQAGKFFMPVAKHDARVEAWLKDSKGNAELYDATEEKTKAL